MPLAASVHGPGTLGVSTTRSPCIPIACSTSIYCAMAYFPEFGAGGTMPAGRPKRISTAIGIEAPAHGRCGRGTMRVLRNHGLRRDRDEMNYHKLFIVEPGAKVRLGKIDPAFKGHYESQESAKAKMEEH